MSVENATRFLERMRDDTEFRKTFVTSQMEVIGEMRRQALLEAEQRGYEFTREELGEARVQLFQQFVRKLESDELMGPGGVCFMCMCWLPIWRGGYCAIL